MEINDDHFRLRREKAREIFSATKSLYNPYFGTHVILNSDGFHHLQFSSRHERSREEQLLKFRLLPLALETIRRPGTIQEYRKLLTPIGKKSPNNGSIPMKEVEYWGLIAILGSKEIKIRTVLRRVGDGNITFWSVMPDVKIRRGVQKMFDNGIEDG